VELEVTAKDLAFVNYYGKWTLEAGEFALSVGDQNQTINCTETIVWEQPNID
jgi:beta-glucosidase